MRGNLSLIQQTLTPEATGVLSHSVAEASRRNHAQTTPLHVAATLLAPRTGFLRQACIWSHPNSSHPLQGGRALELCFRVALDRIPTALNSSDMPHFSNALMASLKRAQAQQRRGCCPVEVSQQQPLLKVELEQFILSILDDPTVSRVMREASFSSVAVKAVIEQFLNPQLNSETNSHLSPGIGLGFNHGPKPIPWLGSGVGSERNSYLNPRLVGSRDDVNRVLDILSRFRKRNPVLVGEFEAHKVVKAVLGIVEKDEIHDRVVKGLEVISVEKELGLVQGQLPTNIMKFEGLIDKKMELNCKGGSGVVIDLGDLKWLVDHPSNQRVSEVARDVVSEMGKLLRKYGEGSKIWFIGSATCETYSRCQVYHPTIESEWELQVVSIVATPRMLPRLGSNGGILSTSVECLTPMKGFTMAALPLTRRVSENLDPVQRFSCCPHCTEKYDQELAKLNAEQVESSLPPWLQNAKMHADNAVRGATDLPQSMEQQLILSQKIRELQIEWSQTCLQLHPNFHHNASSERIIPSPKLQQPRYLGDGLRLNVCSPVATLVDCDVPKRTPESPVRTDLALGPVNVAEAGRNNAHMDRLKDFLGCNINDVNSFKRLLKGLIEKVGWQTDAASAIASTIIRCKLGNGKPRVTGLKGYIWLLFLGPDRVGKKKMSIALSELVCGVRPSVIALGSGRDCDGTGLNLRGKTIIDRIAEAVRKNLFSVIMLEDIDDADSIVRGSIKHAMERGRLIDSHGREVSLGNVIFILTSTWTPHHLKDGVTLNEEKTTSLASGGWQLRITQAENITRKRSPSWPNDDQERSIKQRKELSRGLSFDLNQLADDDRLDESQNSSDLTVEHEEDPMTSSPEPNELVSSVDETIVFKPVDFASIRHTIERVISSKFSTMLGDNFSVKIECEALEKISSGIWLGETTLDSWVEKVVVPSIQQLKTILSSCIDHSTDRKMSVRLELDQESGSRGFGDWLPGTISVVANV